MYENDAVADTAVLMVALLTTSLESADQLDFTELHARCLNAHHLCTWCKQSLEVRRLMIAKWSAWCPQLVYHVEQHAPRP